MTVVNGKEESAFRAVTVLRDDPATGTDWHADAEYEPFVKVDVGQGVKIPMIHTFRGERLPAPNPNPNLAISEPTLRHAGESRHICGDSYFPDSRFRRNH